MGSGTRGEENSMGELGCVLQIRMGVGAKKFRAL